MLQKWRESLAVGVYLIPEEIILFSLKLIQTLCNPGDVFQLFMGLTWVHPWRAAGSRGDLLENKLLKNP